MPQFTTDFKTKRLTTRDGKFYDHVKKVKISSNGYTDILEYDKDGFLIEDPVGDNPYAWFEVKRTFDNSHNLIFEYNKFVEETSYSSDSRIEKIYYIYDCKNQLIEEFNLVDHSYFCTEYGSRSIPDETYRKNYIYNEDGLLIQVRYSKNHIIFFYYDEMNYICKIEEYVNKTIDHDIDGNEISGFCLINTEYKYHYNHKIQSIITNESQVNNQEDSLVLKANYIYSDTDDSVTIVHESTSKESGNIEIDNIMIYKNFDCHGNPTLECRKEDDIQIETKYEFEYWNM